MTYLFHDLIRNSAVARPDADALLYQQETLTYAGLLHQVERVSLGFKALDLRRGDRVAIYLEKRFETVIAIFATTLAGGVFVPVNPALKPEQVSHILQDCGAKILITSAKRLEMLQIVLPIQHDLRVTIVVDADSESQMNYGSRIMPWLEMPVDGIRKATKVIDNDMAAIIYTSGSTGKPKGVILSHRNLVAGAKSVSAYLHNHSGDRILAVLPLSFDYGLSQLTTAFYVGATNILMNYWLPRDILENVAMHQITGLAAVPSLWIQLAALDWHEINSLRYMTSSGGAIPFPVIQRFRKMLPATHIFSMYGFTEAFRSTYLAPEEIDYRPKSIGKAIPNAEVFVLRQDGTHCAPGEPGELVHRGATVALGYWGDREKTARVFRTITPSQDGMPINETVAWSGDTVKIDADGFLYFIERRDSMIKSSGYRISPTEIEEVLYGIENVREATVFGVPHPILGQAIVALITAQSDTTLDVETIMLFCKNKLPSYMCPHHLEVCQFDLPRNLNNKIDRNRLAKEMQRLFTQNES
ncbi:acyl-CoA ligase (AMP-forming), exosortase A-associated [Nitrosomonas sp. PY1]|uniref:acyl-CoA ligase (AMP-forming), exosortase A system-associated n=1 Tax=Nitrosomonas sp. PY1 TaxID=1803906 RepID=UPI001FC8A307|nr:acyl-CoA ligase (AMP-forming), exosortase A system-associated [Nitrosomonas sp. PY1]GKS68724.1 acyl-CoA ligase (AMP-forming), exosortase A-associated [Nitrosomonas sp. PY1]